MRDSRTRWNRRYRSDPPLENPSDFIVEHVDALPRGGVLDVACGGGRNAIFLAEHGFDVVGIDSSDVGLEHARARAERASVDVEFVHADVHEFELDAYDVIVVSHFRVRERLPDLVRALEPGGVILYEHRLRVDDRGSFRVEPNELLHALLSLRLVRYEEPFEPTAGDETVRVVARKPPEATT